MTKRTFVLAAAGAIAGSLLTVVFITAAGYLIRRHNDSVAAELRVHKPTLAAVSVATGGPLTFDSPRQGTDAAPVGMIEFGDFQCPYCARFDVDTLPRLRTAFIEPGVLRFSFEQFPLSNHRLAVPAAHAALCAGQQGKYWQMHELLFTHQRTLPTDSFVELAHTQGVDSKEFEACLASGDSRDLELGKSAGLDAGVTVTPTFVLGVFSSSNVLQPSVTITGAQPYELFDREIRAVETRAADKSGQPRK